MHVFICKLLQKSYLFLEFQEIVLFFRRQCQSFPWSVQDVPVEDAALLWQYPVVLLSSLEKMEQTLFYNYLS